MERKAGEVIVNRLIGTHDGRIRHRSDPRDLGTGIDPVVALAGPGTSHLKDATSLACNRTRRGSIFVFQEEERAHQLSEIGAVILTTVRGYGSAFDGDGHI
jgi:hypothetical protein